MKIIITTALLLTSLTTFAETKSIDCRDAIVAGYASIGTNAKRDGFASHNFEDLNVTVAEFNNMSPDLQSYIYNQVMPLSLVIEQTLQQINSVIDQIKGSPYEFFYIDELQVMRSSRDQLRICINNG